jgi:hypothetical protein
VPPPRLFHDHGQSSLEWLAVVLLVSSLMALGAGLAQADAVGRRVTREMARALCLVSGGDCRRDQEPCVESSESNRSKWSAGVSIFRLGADSFGLIERLSDGTYAVSVGHGLSGGVEAEYGFGVEAHVAGLDVSAGGTVTASILAGLEGTRTWFVGSQTEAESILAAGGASRPPDRSSHKGGTNASAGASAKLEVDGLGDVNAASASVTFDQEAGGLTDHRTGHRTMYVDAKTSGSVSALEGVLTANTGDAREIYTVELAADGRPLVLQITATGAFKTSRDLPDVVQPIVGRLEPEGANRYEVTATLDLNDPAALRAATEMLDDIAHKRGRAKPSAALRDLVASTGTVEARILATTTNSDKNGVDVTAGTHVVNLGHETEHTEQHLLAAASRGLDGQWIAREDCVA